MVRVGVWFPPEDEQIVRELADKHFDGNLSMALRVACKEALLSRGGTIPPHPKPTRKGAWASG